MERLVLNNQDYANDFRNKINTNFEQLFNSHTPTSHAVNNDTYGLGTTQLYGHLRVQAANGLGVASGTITMAQANTSSFGAVKLASSAASNSATDVVTSKILNDATRGQTTLPKIYYGTTEPSASNTPNSIDGDIYIKYA